VTGEEVDFPAKSFIGEERGGSEASVEASGRPSDGLAEAVVKAVAHCRAAGAGKEEAEDCVQDAVVDMLTSRSAGAAVRRPEAWLTVVARRRLVDCIRRRRAEQTALYQGLAWVAQIAPEQDVAESVADRDLARRQVAALADLPPVTQEVCQATSAGLAVGQVAEEVGISTRSVEAHLTRARTFLRSLARSSGLVVIYVVVRRLTRDHPWMEVADRVHARVFAASALVVTVGVASGPSDVPGRPHSPRPRPPAASGAAGIPVPGHDRHPAATGGPHPNMSSSQLRAHGSSRGLHASDASTVDLTVKLPSPLPPLPTDAAAPALRNPSLPAASAVTGRLTGRLPSLPGVTDRLTGLSGTRR
jgi:RNA polymerase sigma factor (sigma-70 family)